MTRPPETVDEIPWSVGDEHSERIRTAQPRPCKHLGKRHHENRPVGETTLIVEVCNRCGHTFDPGRQRLGRLALRRGKEGERRIARMTGRKRIGHRGGDVDVGDQADPDVWQVKTGPSYWPTRIVAQLEKLAPSRGGRPRFLAFVESGHHGGRRARVVVCLYLHDLPDDVAAQLFPAIAKIEAIGPSAGIGEDPSTGGSSPAPAPSEDE